MFITRNINMFGQELNLKIDITLKDAREICEQTKLNYICEDIESRMEENDYELNEKDVKNIARKVSKALDNNDNLMDIYWATVERAMREEENNKNKKEK